MQKKILIVDDDEVIRDAVRISLIEEGHRIFEAEDGKKAFSIAKDVRPDLVILDVMMPGMNGYRVCQEIKKDPDTAHAYVIFLTARGHSLTDDAVVESGGDDLINKPFMPADLRDKVRSVLG